mmetsp:Transcript_46803/g.77712  ORF Transcript_46803/g.77712 Transcript_46803/m.77712 type:complete len:205 (-) Transcript_46803:1160-1774(-)
MVIVECIKRRDGTNEYLVRERINILDLRQQLRIEAENALHNQHAFAWVQSDRLLLVSLATASLEREVGNAHCLPVQQAIDGIVELRRVDRANMLEIESTLAIARMHWIIAIAEKHIHFEHRRSKTQQFQLNAKFRCKGCLARRRGPRNQNNSNFGFLIIVFAFGRNAIRNLDNLTIVIRFRYQHQLGETTITNHRINVRNSVNI